MLNRTKINLRREDLGIDNYEVIDVPIKNKLRDVIGSEQQIVVELLDDADEFMHYDKVYFLLSDFNDWVESNYPQSEFPELYWKCSDIHGINYLVQPFDILENEVEDIRDTLLKYINETFMTSEVAPDDFLSMEYPEKKDYIEARRNRPILKDNNETFDWFDDYLKHIDGQITESYFLPIEKEWINEALNVFAFGCAWKRIKQVA